MLKAYLNYAGDNWVDLLPLLEFNYNATPNGSGVSPFEIDILRVPNDGSWRRPAQGDPALIVDLKEAADAIALVVRESLKEAQDRQARMTDHKRKHQAFQVGAEVLLATEGLNVSSITTLSTKLSKAWIGPFKVTAVHNYENYELDLPHEFSLMHPVFHTSLLKPYNRREAQPEVGPKLVRKNGKTEQEWPAEAILKHRPSSNRYLVKWKGHDESQNTWEPYEHVKGTTVLAEFEKRLAEESARVPREERKRRGGPRAGPQKKQKTDAKDAEAEPIRQTGGATRRDPRNVRETRSKAAAN
jgi:hypothetical protein